MTDPAIPAATALAEPPSLPLTTEQVTGGADPAPAAPPAAPADQTKSSKGEIYNRAEHEWPPRENTRGGWARKRGNGARLAKGLPPTGSRIALQAPAEPTSDAAPAATPEPAPAPDAPAADPAAPAPAAGPSSLVVDAVPVAPEAGGDLGGQPFDAYRPSAETANGIVFGGLLLLLGDAWVQDKAEERSHVDAWQRTLHRLQAPFLHPVLELVAKFIVSFAKRSKDPTTRSRLGAFFGWVKAQTAKPAPPPRRQPGEPDPDQRPAGPPQPPPAAAAPYDPDAFHL